MLFIPFSVKAIVFINNPTESIVFFFCLLIWVYIDEKKSRRKSSKKYDATPLKNVVICAVFLWKSFASVKSLFLTWKGFHSNWAMANQLNIGLLARTGLCQGGLSPTAHSDYSASDSETELNPSKRKVSENAINN